MSNWVGKIGENIEADITVIGYIFRPNWKDKSRLIILKDEAGNILTIKTVGIFRSGQKWRIDGVVKRHHIFGGQKQTHISEWGFALLRK